MENFHFESSDRQPDTSPEILNDQTGEKEQDYIRETMDLLTHSYRSTHEASEEVRTFVSQWISELPKDIQSAVHSYAVARDLETWKEQSGLLSSEASMRISDRLRKETHDRLARLLTAYNPDIYPDLITAREKIKEIFEDLTSKDVIDAKRDNDR